ncbi:MAG: hypothetical protein IPO37_02645 [Saprospiraceae bacterium]|nr:hypothetical protein [Saprospiraceae bacterium]
MSKYGSKRVNKIKFGILILVVCLFNACADENKIKKENDEYCQNLSAIVVDNGLIGSNKFREFFLLYQTCLQAENKKDNVD